MNYRYFFYIAQLLTLVSLVVALDGNSTNETRSEAKDGPEDEPVFITNATTHRRVHHYKGIPWFRLQFDHVVTPLTLGLWMCLMTVSKTVVHRVKFLQNILPESAQLIVLGLMFGAIHFIIFPEKELYLHPDLFFLVLLPPIVLDAGYSLQVKEFYQNIGTILTYAVAGTIINTVGIGLTLCLFRSFFSSGPSFINILQFATLISAVDPVAVICVFEEMHVNRILHICVFGESLLNDAVSVVLYNTLNIMADVGVEDLETMDYVKSVVSFFTVSIGGILVGVFWALLTACMTRASQKVATCAVFGCLIFPYMSYVLAEAFGVSGILAIMACGIAMRPFIHGNVTHEAEITLQYTIKTLSSSSEALIFIFLGVSCISRNHDVGFIFILVTLMSCLAYRFLGVYSLTYLLNKKRMQKISIVDQFIMAYGGIRGAVCYGLVMSLDTDVVPCRNMFTTAVIVVILFTTFIQGGTIKHFVNFLRVKKCEERKKMVFDMIMDNTMNLAIGGIESIAGQHGDYWLRRKFNCVYDQIKPYLMAHVEDRGMKIVRHNEEIQVNEAVSYLRKHGSFAGMTTVQSKPCLLPQSQSMVAPPGGFAVDMSPTADGHLAVPPGQGSLPRNVSLATFVRGKLDTNAVNSNRRYSRHFVEADLRNRLPAHLLSGQDSVDKDESIPEKECYLTFPYSRSSQKDLIIANIRKVSRPNGRDIAPGSNGSPWTTPRETTEDAKRSARPQFFITSDTNELTAATEAAQRNPPTSYHIGRFEVENDRNVPTQRKNSGQRSRNGTIEDAAIPLMPIAEQDESKNDSTVGRQ
ncbi:sodium/hydrogen exchanger 3 family protein [Aphelenchoides avenae]|nr:sodium/hydrogen exchanger 3 family protein [Aphelenchus avenae]